MIIKRKEFPLIADLLVRCVPGNRKHDVILREGTTAEPRGGWSGGSRDVHIMADAHAGSGRIIHTRFNNPFQDDVNVPSIVEIPEGCVLITAGTWRGRNATPKITASASTFKQLGVDIND